MKNTTYFCYREAHSEKELEELLRLRYQVYRNSRLAGFCPENAWGIDLDAWDARSLHFGLFRCDGSTEEPVGYMRVIQEGETHQAGYIRSIAWRKSAEMLETVANPPEVPFPAMSYFPGAMEKFGPMLAEASLEGKKYGEASRLVLREDCSGLKLTLSLIEYAIAINFIENGFHRSVLTCSQLHSRIYNHYGWQQVEGTKTEEIVRGEDRVPRNLMVMRWEDFLQNAPVEIRHRVKRMALAYRETGRIHYYPDQPNYYYPPAYFTHHRPTSQRFMSAMYSVIDRKSLALVS